MRDPVELARAGPEAVFHLDDRRSVGRQKTEGRLNHLTLPLTVAGRTQRTAHGMAGDDGPGQRHEPRYVTEAGDVDAHGRNTGLLDGPLNVSHGHVAHRSNRNKQGRVDLFVVQTFSPLTGHLLLEPHLGCRPNKGVRRRCQLADDTVVSQGLEMAKW